ncbi:hypothetical protein [Mesorhizobium sp. L2C084A000]|uniref:hypothetical protein n=1 Tax=Mesorhizobium sp. L2C084A000 TaxID=1287116 RepID=UPI0003D0125F|nr:hypothetical protein [Mesorhizobium sp. L2C084A000]ESZ28013.1 hypothetical protein X734_09630 [Mesorhizobium sp. L2C084A000]
MITVTIPPDRLDDAIANPDALKIAYDVGVLELLGISLSILGVALVVIGFAAYFSVQRAAKQAARDVAVREVPRSVDEHIRKDAFAVIKGVLKDPQTLAAIQAEMDRLGLTDVTDAGDVEGNILDSYDAKRTRSS